MTFSIDPVFQFMEHFNLWKEMNKNEQERHENYLTLFGSRNFIKSNKTLLRRAQISGKFMCTRGCLYVNLIENITKKSKHNYIPFDAEYKSFRVYQINALFET